MGGANTTVPSADEPEDTAALPGRLDGRAGPPADALPRRLEYPPVEHEDDQQRHVECRARREYLRAQR